MSEAPPKAPTVPPASSNVVRSRVQTRYEIASPVAGQKDLLAAVIVTQTSTTKTFEVITCRPNNWREMSGSEIMALSQGLENIMKVET
jgi:hypothetical protein